MSAQKLASPSIEYKRSEDFAEFYANNALLQPSTWDLKILLGELDLSQGPNVVVQHTALTLPWPQVKVMAYFLQLHLIWYESIHGRAVIPKGIIPELPAEPPKDPAQQFMPSKESWALVRKLYADFIAANPEAKP